VIFTQDCFIEKQTLEMEKETMKRTIVLMLVVLAAFSIPFVAGCEQKPDAEHKPVAEEKAPVAKASEAADFVFTNGKVYTVNESQPWAEAVAVKGNKIVYVGDAKGAEAFIGEGTEKIDLAGKMLLPGFFSAHEHLIASAWVSLGVNLGAGQSKEDYLKLIKEYADANPDEEFIRGIGWNATLMGDQPTAADLDAIVADRPVMLQDYTIHDMWMNSKAMEMGGVTKDTPDPFPGLIYWVRDEEGNPTGYAKEFAWMGAYVAAGAWQPEKMMAESQNKLYDTAASFGYTGYINQGLVTPNLKDLDKHYEDQKTALKMLDDLHKEGRLKLRTFLQVLYKSENSSVEDLIKNATELRNQYHSDMIGISGIKVHPEGVFTSHASVMLEPWSDQPDKIAKRGVSAKRTDEVVMAANKAGFDVSVHVDGSKTVRETIDSYIKAKEAGFTDARNTLEHFVNVHPDDMQRVIKYKIPVNLTPIWATSWAGGLDSALQILGEERTINNYQQIRTAVDGGTNVSIAADVPSTDAELMGALTQSEAAITRMDPSNPDDTRIFPPKSQALTLEQCLYAATMAGAYQARMEDKVGSIEVGKYADLVILEKNLFDVAPRDISEVKVEGTMMDGKFTYQAKDEVSRGDANKKYRRTVSMALARRLCCGMPHSVFEQHDHQHASRL
jgi:predicted amidohydrolase YtcJ